MNEKDFDALLAAHARGYNAPPVDPPLLEIRRRMHAERRRRAMRWRVSASLAAAAVVIFAVGLINSESGTSLTVSRESGAVPAIPARSSVADRAVAAALRSAAAALSANPEDPYFIEHMASMQSNAEYFRRLEERHAGGTT